LNAKRVLLFPCLAGLLVAVAAAARADGADPAAGHVSRGERMAAGLRSAGWSDDAIIAGISTLPIVELRGAIPVGIGFLAMPWWRAYLVAVVGNMLPIPFILLLLGPVSRVCMKMEVGRRFFEWLFHRTRSKTASIEKYETFGLTVFVAIPLPVTGAWTGAMAAFLLGLGFRHAMVSIFLGVLVAGAIMTVLSVLGWIGAMIAGVVLLALAAGALRKMFSREERASSMEGKGAASG